MRSRTSQNFNEPKIFLLFLLVVTSAIILFYFIASMITSIGYHAFLNTDTAASKVNDVTIILDPGHGGEDPGATANGAVEKSLNLSMALKIADLLKLSGYNVRLTRSEDRMLYNDGEEKRKKYYDLYNRTLLAEGESNAVFISIHMNKFPIENCSGLQAFYSPNNPSNELLATTIQNASKLVNANNKRNAKIDDGKIFLLKQLRIPAVLIECGFLSNPEDAKLLLDDHYRNQLSFALYCGIIDFLEEYTCENQLYMQ